MLGSALASCKTFGTSNEHVGRRVLETSGLGIVENWSALSATAHACVAACKSAMLSLTRRLRVHSQSPNIIGRYTETIVRFE